MSAPVLSQVRFPLLMVIGPKSTPLWVNGGLNTVNCASVKSDSCCCSLTLCLLQYKHTLITSLQTDLHETIQYFSLVKETKWSRPQWWLDLWVNSTMIVVMWWSLERIIGFFDSSGKKLCFSLPPIWSSSFLINGCNSKILLLCNGRSSFIIVNCQANLSCWTILIVKYWFFTKWSKNILAW